MAESLIHIDLVRKITSYISSLSSSFSASLIEADLPEHGRTPKVIHGYYPDVRYRDKEVIVIGEAKTQHDIDNEHTENQWKAYIDEVRTCNLQRHIVYSVPFVSFVQVKNKLRHVKEKGQMSDITIHVIDNFNRVASL